MSVEGSGGADASGVRAGHAHDSLRLERSGRVELGDERVEIVRVAHVFTG
jgi:hypothetical protein